MYVCDWVRDVDHLSFRLSCSLRPSAPALPCLGFLTGGCLGFRCMCAARVPVAPTVGAVPLCLCLVPLPRRGRVSVVCWVDACTALLACVGGLAFVVCAFGGYVP